jgi:hypothetical protein
MQPLPRPFFLSFEQALHERLSRRELMQAMDEAMWEYASMHARDPAGRVKRHVCPIRIGSICLAFFRLMTKSGYSPEEANARINQACQTFEGPLEPVPKAEDCAVAGYFLAKGEPALCEAAFCSRCALKNTGCPSRESLRTRVAPDDGNPERTGGLNGARSGRALQAGITA